MHIGADDFVRRGDRARDAAFDLAVFNARGQNRKGFRRIVAGLHFQGGPIDAAAIEPRRRAGFQTAERKADRFQRARKPHGRRFSDAASGNLLFADMDEAAQEGAGGENHGAAGNLAAIGEFHPANAAIGDDEIVGLRLKHLQIRRFANGGLHCGGIELAIGLRARTAHGRALAAVQNAELDAALVGDAAHEAVQSIDFADQMALAETANRRIAAHRADGGKTMRHQRGLRAHAGTGGGGFTAGMTAANDDNVESCAHRTSDAAL